MTHSGLHAGIPGFQASIVLAGSSPFNVFDFLPPSLPCASLGRFLFVPNLDRPGRGLLFMPRPSVPAVVP